MPCIKPALVRALSAAFCLGSTGVLLYASKVETKRYQLETLKVKLAGLKPLSGTRSLRILHLSDLHLCHPESSKVDFLEQVTNDDFDLVFLTGDIFENFTGLAYTRSILTRKPRAGAYAVLGNHDYYHYSLINKTLGKLYRKLRTPSQRRQTGPMIKALESSGFSVLRNTAINLPEHGLHIIGIDYPTIDNDHLQALAGQAQTGQAIFVLFHLPLHLERLSNIGTQLACGGHTHGGQVRLPGLGAIVTDSELPRTEASGLIRRGQTIFHISRGLGADPRTNIRLFCPPAATILEVSWI